MTARSRRLVPVPTRKATRELQTLELELEIPEPAGRLLPPHKQAEPPLRWPACSAMTGWR